MPTKKNLLASSSTEVYKDDPLEDLLEKYSPIKCGKIFPINARRKPLLMDSYRPKENECLDYHLSETYFRWDVGDTKIRGKQIVADYVHAPPGYVAKPPPQYSAGGKPCWKNIYERWRERVEKRQARYREEFAEYVKNRRTSVIQRKSKTHDFLQEEAGPPWYQELSFRQMGIADHLQWCIEKDLQTNSIENTKDNLAQLGLYYRANSTAIKIALKYCCANDVEFLLVLYQIAHPQREEYSINDRLILSAVYHLCATETLREMHVRMPSPPRVRPPKPEIEPPKKPKKQKYPSPYLEPYTFKPDPPKHTGIYKKVKNQYPEHPYFVYLKPLREEIANAVDPREIDTTEIEDPVDLEIIEEMLKAQIMYDRLPHPEPKFLVKPSIKIRCQGFNSTKDGQNGHDQQDKEVPEIALPALAELIDHEEPCTCDQEDPDKVNPICCPNNFPCLCPEDECDCKRKARFYLASLCKRCDLEKRKKQRMVVCGLKQMPDCSLVPIIHGFYKEKECGCRQRFIDMMGLLCHAEQMEVESVKYIISGVFYTKDAGAAYIIQAAKTPLGYDVPSLKKKVCGKAICDCADIEDFKKQKLMPIEKPKTPPDMPWEEAHCNCREQLKRFLEEQCQCEECKEILREENRDLLIGGSKGMPCCGGTTIIPVVQGVQDRHCDCLYKYEQFIKKLDEYRSRVKTRVRMLAQEHKYSIGGVVQTRDGPVYTITGMRTPLKCICEQVQREMREEAEHEMIMAKIPYTGRHKYGFAGVYGRSTKDVEEGEGDEEEEDDPENRRNLFVLSHALPNKPCRCERLYQAFSDEHKDCIDYFEEFLKSVMNEIMQYEMEEQKLEKQNEKLRLWKLRQPRPEPERRPYPEPEEPCPCEDDDYAPQRPSADIGTQQEKSPTQSLSSIESRECICFERPPLDEPPPCDECADGGNKQPAVESPEEKPAEPEDSGEVYDLKRFIILESITCDEKTFEEIIKKLLASLDEDGYPLAKLPDAYKLPIFKLWMYLRCYKFWRWEDRKPFNAISERYNKHCFTCYPNVPWPVPAISRKKAAQMTWANAHYVKALIAEAVEGFYRQIKKDRIDGMREFFPSMFNYEFPEFRDCFFAYMPSKEEDIYLETVIEKDAVKKRDKKCICF